MRRMKPMPTALMACLLALTTVAAPQAEKVKVDFKETVLKNGLRVITAENHRAPVAAVVVTYDVGSRNEAPGRTGLAHLFEHMMFEGSARVGRREHTVLVANQGGAAVGTTNTDRTNYFNTLPANQLDLGLSLESDRMRSLAITQENLDNQRDVVQEEQRLRVNQPYGRTLQALWELIYDNFGYKHWLMGAPEDLKATTVKDAQEFYHTHYIPNKAVLTIVGDFKTDEALAKVRKYFEDIPRRPDPPYLDLTEPEQTLERRTTIEDQLARLPNVALGFKAAPGNTPDFYALQVLSAVLQSGQSSRLYQKLVREQELVANLDGDLREMRGPSLLYTLVTVRPGKKTEEVEAAIYAEHERLQKELISDLELQKAKSAVRRAFLGSIRDSVSRAITLGQFATFYQDPNLINTRLDRVTAVTKADVQRVVNKYLKPTNRTIGITIPKAKSATTAR